MAWGGGATWGGGGTTTIAGKTLSVDARLEGDVFRQKVIGRPIPIGIGTFPVVGMPVYGGAKIVTTVVQDPLTVEATAPAGSAWGGSGSSWGGSTGWLEEHVPTYTQTIETSFQAGYLLATNPFGVAYELMRLEVDDVVVFDAENGVEATMPFRFYDGLHSTTDPIVTAYVDANPGAHVGDILVFLPKVPTTDPPVVKAVISSAASLAGASTAWIDYIGAVPSFFEPYAAYDAVDGLIYHFNHLGPEVIVLSTETELELYRFAMPSPPLEPTTFIALPGTGFVMASSYDTPAPYELMLVNAMTGELVATATPPGKDWEALALYQVMGAGTVQPGAFAVLAQYLTVHSSNPDPANSAIVIADIATGSIEVFDCPVAYDGWSYACPGRKLAGSISFFVAEWVYGTGGGGFGSSTEHDATTIVELTWSGDSISTSTVYTAPVGYFVAGVAYDPQTGYLVVPVRDTNGSTTPTSILTKVVNPNTGAEIASLTSPVNFEFYQESQSSTEASNRLFQKPGFVLLPSRATDVVYSLNLSDFTFSLFATYPSASSSQWDFGIYDQGRGFFLSSEVDGADLKWKKNSVAAATAGTITLQALITSIMSLAGYEAAELTFTGFTGINTYGYVIDRDTNIRTVLQSLADVFDFAFCDTGDGYVFTKPGRDGSASIDATIPAAQILFKNGGSVESQDEAEIRTVAKMTLEYFSKDSGYEAGAVSDDRPRTDNFLVTNSVREGRVSLPLVDTDAAMQQRVTEKLHQTVVGRRLHRFSTTPTYAHMLPGDILAIPSDDQVYTVMVDQVTLGRDMRIGFEATDFLADVSSLVTTVSNNPVDTAAGGNFATQYFHMDIPLYRYGDDADGVALVEYAVLAPRGQDDWPGAVLFDGSTPGDLVASVVQPPVVPLTGLTSDALAAPAEDYVSDHVSTVTLRLGNGDAALLVSKTEAEVLLGANLAFIGRPGRWEGVGFETVTDNGDGTYTLSDFTVRGWRGTEVYEGTHAVGDFFILADAQWLKSHEVDDADFGLTRYYKALGIGADINSGAPLPFTASGAAEKPYAPVNLTAAIDGSDIDLGCDYRTRLSAWEFFEASPDSGETTLSFEWDIMSGSTVLRTLTSSTNAVTYAAADITTDFGSMPASLKFRVYMMSAAVGRGHMAEATITL